MADYQLTVGLEIHVQLKTKTKMFCGCKNDPFNSAPNTNVCTICYGLPGALPLLNRSAVQMTLELGQALGGTIAPVTFWARKNYFYPDLPKGYQISQSTAPVIDGGKITIDGTDYRLHHAHLEEDAGKLTHQQGKNYSLVDYNRAGTPLLELVTEPDFHISTEAKRFCQELQRIVRHLGVSDADMEKGQMRCEANISVSKTDTLGNKVEVKNINSFRSVEKAIEYEYARQIEVLEDGGVIAQETRTWNDTASKTVSMRSKETSADYRYFPEPDLPVVKLETNQATGKLLPEQQRQQLQGLGLSSHVAEVLVDKHFYETVVAMNSRTATLTKDAANTLIAVPEFGGLGLDQQTELLEARTKQGWAKETFAEHIRSVADGKSIAELVNQGSEVDINAVISEVIAQNSKPVADYKSGKENALHFLVGQVMAKTKGQANINAVRDELKKAL